MSDQGIDPNNSAFAATSSSLGSRPSTSCTNNNTDHPRRGAMASCRNAQRRHAGRSASRSLRRAYILFSIGYYYHYYCIVVLLLFVQRHDSEHSAEASTAAMALFPFSVFAEAFAPSNRRGSRAAAFPTDVVNDSFLSPFEAARTTTAASTTSATAIEPNGSNDRRLTRSDLNKMTIKELKSYILENDMEIPRGEASQLKLKKQIVDFIWGYCNDNGNDNASASGNVNGGDDEYEEDDADDVNGESTISASDPDQTIASNSEEVIEDLSAHANGESNDGIDRTDAGPARRKPSKRSMGTGMPPLSTTLSATATKEPRKSSKSYNLTPKDRIVLDVLQIYPPLYDAMIAAYREDNDIDDDHPPLLDRDIDLERFCDISSLNYKVPNDIGEGDIRHRYHPILRKAAPTDMDIVFVGTASCTPGVTRGVSCTAVRLNWRSGRTALGEGQERKMTTKEKAFVEERGPTGGTWLFDCGEATQLSIQRTSSVKPGKISKIFITHCHGDHSFGLPGLLCLMGTDRDRDAPPVDIYGPEGLRMWLRVAIRYSVSRVVPPYRVHELMDVPMAPEWEEGHLKNGRYYFQLSRDRDLIGNGGKGNNSKGWSGRGTRGLAGEDPASWISRAPMINLEPSKDFGEIEGGRDIYPLYDHPDAVDGAPVWEVEDEGDVVVRAAPMSHGVPCVGYVIQENDKPGRLRPENVTPVIQRNYDGLIEAGVKNPMKIMAVVKSLPVGGSYTFPDGTVIHQEDVVEPPRKGRKIVICGDTADSRALEGLAQNADVLVHEATNTYLPGVDKDTNLRLVTKDAKVHGHSTPFMAGNFAKRIKAKKLVLTHFSARYKGDQSIESITIMTRMERQAMKASGLREDTVACAWDYMVLPVQQTDKS
mmetsp:Transcript_10468/g.20206  ORF Transcript_10468/g.20206 Transcript_10468/m.20206 type:complete len:879 (-) Transcript_10468:43-2679(-)